MPRHILYAYVDDYDRDDHSSELIARIEIYLSGRTWISRPAWLVNQCEELSDLRDGDDLPHRNVGINLELPDPGAELFGWFEDVESIAHFCAGVYGETGKMFVLGIANNETGVSEDLFFVETTLPNIDELKTIIGVESNF